MPMRACLTITALTGLLAFVQPVQARDVTATIHWNIQRSELSITRLRLMVAPKINRAACKSYWNILKSGGSVNVKIVGAGSELITSFHVTRDKCKT
jgi:hypothetical protein